MRLLRNVSTHTLITFINDQMETLNAFKHTFIFLRVVISSLSCENLATQKYWIFPEISDDMIHSHVITTMHIYSEFVSINVSRNGRFHNHFLSRLNKKKLRYATARDMIVDFRSSYTSKTVRQKNIMWL